ncbi:MAG: DNA modification methylase [Bacteroidales bacterium]|nr:DNA modification methylase [Bacteroidales bacterium]
MKEFGFKVPIVIDRDNVIVCGHTRFKAAMQLGLESVPCLIADDLTEEQIKAFRLADNKTGEIAEWDFDLLISELEDLDIDMGAFGFEEIEEPKEVEEDNFDVNEALEGIEEPETKPGDVYILGDHRLMCGDSRSIDDLDVLLDGSLADLVVTDPPYNMGYEGAGNTPDHKRKKNKILNDKMSDTDFEQFLTDVYITMFAGMKDGASCYVFYKELGKGVFITAMEKGGITFKQELIWVKNQIVLGGSKYQSMYEPCLFGCKGKSIANWYVGRKERSVIESIDDMNEIELRDALRELLQDVEGDVVRERKTLKNDLHPTMKPIRLLARFIRNSSAAGDVVLDLFGGSGSTLIACEQMNRKCRMMELDPKYCDVIVKRWEEMTGRKAVRV